MINFQVNFQLGKQGLTDGVINALNTNFKHHRQIRVSVLKSATRDREGVKKLADEIIQKVGYKCDYKIIGFTIILIRLSGKPKIKPIVKIEKKTKTDREEAQRRALLQKKTALKHAFKKEKKRFNR